MSRSSRKFAQLKERKTTKAFHFKHFYVDFCSSYLIHVERHKPANFFLVVLCSNFVLKNFLFVVPPVRLLRFTYFTTPVSPFFHYLLAEGPLLGNVTAAILSYAVYRIFTRAQENCGKPVSI